ncbi:MAG: hypothetical protein ACI9OU_000249 [Candidatus Promineifilaceae bacterium]|jgi:hypothetical protein
MGHKHSDGRELLPWFKLLTVSDSHYIRGYTVGEYWLSRYDQGEAVRFLRDGFTSNPSSFQLHLVLSQILLKVQQDASNDDVTSIGELSEIHQEARVLAERAAELALRQWTPGNPDGSSAWSYYDKNDALACFYQAVLTEQKYGSPQKAIQKARIYLSFVGTNAVLERLAQAP